MPKARSKKFKKRSFHGNRHRNSVPKNNVSTASATKLNTLESSDGLGYEFQELKGNRIIDIQTLLGVFSILSCPKCFATGLKLTEDSKEGLCSNFAIVCKCGFMAGFTSTPKENKKCSLNTLLVFGLRLMGRGFSAGMKLLCTLNLPYVCKKTFRIHELKLLEAVKYSCEENMKAASKEVQNLKKTTTCGVSVDGTWQRRGHISLNGCVSVISIDTGKILDLEVMTQYCKMCEMNIKCDHECSNYKGSSGNMESVGAFRIFERSVMKRELQYTEYYGDGDSKAFLKVKDIYGEDTVTKLECIGHVQKRVGSRLRKLKKKPKDSVEKIQQCLGHEKNPLEWGWVPTRFGLSPRKMERDAAPESFLKIICFNCKTRCKNACGCRKAGLICTSLCTCSPGEACENVSDINLLEDSIEDEDDAPSSINNFIYEDIEDLYLQLDEEDQDQRTELEDFRPGPSKRQKL
ncbi:hypothetical protein AVEN_221005-1 [Araneus ventricosus]|uniref:Mutator-like transposase domain-containing protein n=1 Tax=Araneus ventricosus TaxID=182803 RepID=A0A4Y2ER98_ARAVE|nr:hypothetical protein AVEN_221005-1 [Araneus ventricosus]